MTRLGRRALLAAAGLLLPTVTACGTKPQGGGGGGVDPTGTTGQGTVGLGLVGLVVVDIPRSLAFYRRLGLDVPSDVTGDSYRLSLANGRTFFWETSAVIHTFDPTWQAPTGDRRVVLEFGFPTASALDATYQRLVTSGAPQRLPPFWLTPDIRYAIVDDPDDNQVSLRSPAL